MIVSRTLSTMASRHIISMTRRSQLLASSF